MKDVIEAVLSDFVEQHTGVRPDLKPSKKAHLASSAFLRTDANAAAALKTSSSATAALVCRRIFFFSLFTKKNMVPILSSGLCDLTFFRIPGQDPTPPHSN